MAQFICICRVGASGAGGRAEGGLTVLGQRALPRLGKALVLEQQRLVECGQQLLQHARRDAQPVPDGERGAQPAGVPRPVAQRQQRRQLLGNDDRFLGQLQRVAQQDGWPPAAHERLEVNGP